MTPTELIQEALQYSNRPDLEPDLLSIFPALLKKAHSIQVYLYDHATVHFAAPALVNGKYIIPLNTAMPLLRQVYDLQSYTSFTGLGTEISPYVGVNVHPITWIASSNGLPKKDYFGYTHQYTYHILGRTLSVNNVPADTQLLEFQAAMWPTWEYNDLSDEYESNSWILTEFPILVGWYLKHYAAHLAQKADIVALAQTEIIKTEVDFKREFAEVQYGRKH